MFGAIMHIIILKMIILENITIISANTRSTNKHKWPKKNPQYIWQRGIPILKIVSTSFNHTICRKETSYRWIHQAETKSNDLRYCIIITIVSLIIWVLFNMAAVMFTVFIISPYRISFLAEFDCAVLVELPIAVYSSKFIFVFTVSHLIK